jgi:hypothetical protein
MSDLPRAVHELVTDIAALERSDESAPLSARAADKVKKPSNRRALFLHFNSLHRLRNWAN